MQHGERQALAAWQRVNGTAVTAKHEVEITHTYTHTRTRLTHTQRDTEDHNLEANTPKKNLCTEAHENTTHTHTHKYTTYTHYRDTRTHTHAHAHTTTQPTHRETNMFYSSVVNQIVNINSPGQQRLRGPDLQPRLSEEGAHPHRLPLNPAIPLKQSGSEWTSLRATPTCRQSAAPCRRSSFSFRFRLVSRWDVWPTLSASCHSAPCLAH